MTAPEIVLETRGLTKTFESDGAPVRALRGVDFTMAAGEFVAIMGPSGCGKSTLLNLAAGLDTPTDGKIVLAGESLAGKDENELARMRRAHIGIVFQFFNLLEGMSVLENVTLPAVIAGMSRRRAETRARDLLDLLGLADKATDAPGVLSGGQRQRLAIARALANEPTLVLADEPTGALDSEGGREVLELFGRLHASGQAIERVVSVPERGPAHLDLTPAEQPVVARARVSGATWLQVWLPRLLEDRGDAMVRMPPITHAGELLGFIVVERPADAERFGDADESVLAELARQVGLALHNLQLDSALQESLRELQRRAEELRASRARVVAAADAERRKIERNLHDGAQQHLVALAVTVRLAQQVAASDPEQARVLLEQLGHDLRDAVQELRDLAHGIYPPVLMDRGLVAALESAAGRAALPVAVVGGDVGRFPQEVEAAVYFCCLEAFQNAAKHAGDGARATVTIERRAEGLSFTVADDGVGFDPAGPAGRGHGFVNMSDRVGAIGGTVEVDSAPGRGTRVSGVVPIDDRQ
jgi:ABC-type lipoprotein export system ATPase subunit